MADQDPKTKRDEDAVKERLRKDQAASQRENDDEWLRDQTGEDRNLSGSETYRTLPDQPDTERKRSDRSDANDRQSNR